MLSVLDMPLLVMRTFASFAQALAYLPFYTHLLESVIQKGDIVIGPNANMSAVAVCEVAKEIFEMEKFLKETLRSD